MSAATNQALAAVVAPIVEAAGAYFEGVKVTPAGRRSMVRVVVDDPDGLTLDRVATISRAVSQALDDSNAMGESPYVLEVTSPGVSRPLTLPRHWAGARGRLVLVQLRSGSQLLGRVQESSQLDATLAGEGEPVVVKFEDVSRAVVQVEMSRISEVELEDDEPDHPQHPSAPGPDSDEE